MSAPAVVSTGAATRAHLALGSNLGNREAHVLRAVRAIGDGGVGRVLALSPLYETDPVGMDGAPRFINAVIEVDSPLSPRDLLARLQAIEGQLGRSGGHYAPREIDIDIVARGGTIVNSPALTLPHPRFAERAFVLYPLRDIAPGFRCPRTGLGVDALVERLVGRSGVERISRRDIVYPVTS